MIFGSGKCDYFIVTDMSEYYGQRELHELLLSRYPMIAETERYVIFDLRPK